MAGAYLETGEAIVLTADRVSIGGTRYDAMLTTRRLILIDSSNARFEPRTLALLSVRTVRSGRASTGEPAIILTLTGEGETGESQETILFLQDPFENRIPDRDIWLKTFIELSVSTHRKASPAVFPRPLPKTGMEPSVRRWVAPDIARPRSENFPQDDRPRPVEIHDEGETHDIRPEEPEQEPVSEPAGPAGTRQVPDEPVLETVPEPQNALPAANEHLPEAPAGGQVDLSRSIAAAARSLIAAKAREELRHAHPPRPVQVRKTSAIPEVWDDAAPPVAVVQEPEGSSEEAGPEARVVPVIAAGEPGPGSGLESKRLGETEPAEPVAAIQQDELEPAFLEISPIRLEPEPPATTAREPDTGSDRSDEPAAPPVPEPAEPGTVVTTKEPGKESSGNAPAPEKPEAPAALPAPAASPATDRRPIVTAIAVLLCLLLIAGAFVLLSGGPAGEIRAPPVTTLPTPLATPSVTAPPGTTPVPGSAPTIPGDGVWIRITSDVAFSGQAGNAGYLQPVAGTGERFVRALYDTRPVRVSVQKQDNSGALLTAEVFRDGEIIASRSVTAPMGTVELLIDPVTGLPPGMPAVSPTPEETRAGSGQLEYF